MAGSSQGARLARRSANVLAEIRSYERPTRGVMRSAYFLAARHLTPTLSVSREDMCFHVDTNDVSLGRRTFVEGNYELDEMRHAVQLAEELTLSPALLRGKVFVDVGANIGTSTIPAVKVFGAARVVALEPSAENFRFLNVNIAANSIQGQVQALQLGLSDAAGDAELELSPGNSGDHRVRRSLRAEPGSYGEDLRVSEQVQLSTFDDLVTRGLISLNDVGLIWIDTQGHEGHVLAGAERLGGFSIPVVAEYWPYGLRRSGGLDLIHELISERYARVVDLRASRSAGRTVELAGSQVASLAELYPHETYTDLLLLPN